VKNVFLLATFVLGVFFGVIFTGLSINFTSSNFMIKEVLSPYDYDKTIEVLVNRINNTPGWGIVAVIDQNAAVKKTGGSDIGKLSIIQYCSGKYSSEMLRVDSRKRIAVFMPKSFAVYEKSNGKVYIALSNVALIGKLFDKETAGIIERVSLEVERMLSFINFKFSLF